MKQNHTVRSGQDGYWYVLTSKEKTPFAGSGGQFVTACHCTNSSGKEELLKNVASGKGTKIDVYRLDSRQSSHRETLKRITGVQPGGDLPDPKSADPACIRKAGDSLNALVRRYRRTTLPFEKGDPFTVLSQLAAHLEDPHRIVKHDVGVEKVVDSLERNVPPGEKTGIILAFYAGNGDRQPVDPERMRLWIGNCVGTGFKGAHKVAYLPNADFSHLSQCIADNINPARTFPRVCAIQTPQGVLQTRIPAANDCGYFYPERETVPALASALAKHAVDTAQNAGASARLTYLACSYCRKGVDAGGLFSTIEDNQKVGDIFRPLQTKEYLEMLAAGVSDPDRGMQAPGLEI